MSEVTQATVAQGMNQRRESGFKPCCSHDCAGLKPKFKSRSGPKWPPAGPQGWVKVGIG